MTKQPFATDSTVLQRLYRRFDYLQDFPCEVKGCLIDEATCLGTLETDDFLGFVMGYQVEQETPDANHFVIISREDNLKINHYRHLRPVQPWPQPIIGVAFSEQEPGRVTGTHKVDVMMNNIGNAQLWWGGDVGIIWEAYLDRFIRQRENFEALIHQLWQQCEEYLFAQGVKRIFTHNHDPEFDNDWYLRFLQRRGFEVVSEKAIARCLTR